MFRPAAAATIWATGSSIPGTVPASSEYFVCTTNENTMLLIAGMT